MLRIVSHCEKPKVTALPLAGFFAVYVKVYLRCLCKWYSLELWFLNGTFSCCSSLYFSLRNVNIANV